MPSRLPIERSAVTTTEMRPELLDPYFYSGDPYPTYEWLRRNAPVYWDEKGQIWAISRWRDVMDVENDPRRYTSARGTRPHFDTDVSMINKDDPQHHRQRRIVSRRFTPRAVRRHEDLVREMVTGLIDAVASTGGAEVVEDFAAPLPAMVIAELLGFERSMWPQCKWWSEAVMANLGYEAGQGPDAEGFMRAMQEFYAAATELAELRRREPRDDLMSVWVHTEVDGAPLPHDEIVWEAMLLLDGGAETTRAVIGQTVLALAEHPDQRRKLLDDPTMIERSAVEEFIRWVTPVLSMRRSVTEDHELCGQQLRAGEELILLYGSANRDEEVFEAPDVFDVTRMPNHHVAFGFGTHVCLGANLARLEIRVMMEELLRRLPDFELVAGTQPEIEPGFFTRTLKELKIEFTPEPTSSS